MSSRAQSSGMKKPGSCSPMIIKPFYAPCGGSTFKPALYRELKKLGVAVYYDRTEATAPLTAVVNGKKRDRRAGHECAYR